MALVRRAAVVLALAAGLTAVGGFVLGSLDAPSATYYVFVVAMASAALVRTLAPNVGVRVSRRSTSGDRAGIDGSGQRPDTRVEASPAGSAPGDAEPEMPHPLSEGIALDLPDPLRQLESDERSVLRLAAEGRSMAQIAAQLTLDRQTARGLVDRALAKLSGTTVRELAASRQQLLEAQQMARLGSWEWDIATDRVTWSDELYRIYGVRPERFAGAGSCGVNLDRVHADDRARVARVIENAVAERRPWSLDYRIVRPDGEVRMIHARGEVVCDEQGRPALVQGTCQDVTESRRVEDALRAAEQLFRRVFDDAPIGMALIDLEGRWLRLNRALSHMLGRSEAELRATRLSALNHPDDRERDRPLVEELLSGRRRSFALEKRYVHADGHLIHALVHVSLMLGDGERPLYFLFQLVDITERREAEAALRRAATDVSSEVAWTQTVFTQEDFAELSAVVASLPPHDEQLATDDSPMDEAIDEAAGDDDDPGPAFERGPAA